MAAIRIAIRLFVTVTVVEVRSKQSVLLLL